MNCYINKQHNIFAWITAILLLLMAVPVFSVTPVEVDKLLASDGNNYHEFGYSVGISGDTAVVGSIRHTDPGTGLRSGSAYIYVRNADSLPCPVTGTADPWCEQAELLASDAAANDRFGFWVDIHGDTVVVGSRQDDDAGSNSGSAYVFTRTGTSWAQQAKLTASDAAAFDRFGTSVSVSGNTAVIGAGEADGIGANSGKAYVFTRSGSVWSEEAKLTAADESAGAFFGHKVSLSGDSVLIAAYLDDSTGVDSGSAYVFKRNTAAVACPETATVDPWCQQAKLTSSDAAAGHGFGGAVSLSSNTALVGAPFADGASPGSGASYVFTRSGSNWTEQAKLISSDGATGDGFGFQGAVFGNTAVISAAADDDLGSASGSAYVFLRSSGNWSELQKITASDGMADELFGWNSDISGDTAVLTAPRVFFPAIGGPGSAYVFDINRDETPTGNNVVVAPSPVDNNGDPVENAPEISLAFDTITGNGETTVTITDDGPPPPDGFELVGGAGSTYLEVDTTATFEGFVEICIDYSEIELAVDPASLSLGHFVDGELIDITSSNDLVNMVLCGMTPSFSFFAIVVVTDPLVLLDGLYAAVDALDAKKGTRKKLEKKLKKVEKYLSEGKHYNVAKALTELVDKFVPKVEKERGKHITDAEADDLVDRALDITTILLY